MRRKTQALTVAMVVSFIAFFSVLALVVSGVTQSLDAAVARHVQADVGSSSVTAVMKVVTTVFRPLVLGGIAVALGIILLLRHRWADSIPLLVGVAGGAFLVLPIKDLVHRLRPPVTIVSETGFSFPSDHATVVLLFCGTLLVLFLPGVRSRVWRWVFLVMAGVLIVLVSFSRIYLDVHWFSDIIGGWFLGAGWLCVCLLLRSALTDLLERRKKKEAV